MKTVLLYGGSGFLGSSLYNFFNKDLYTVVISETRIEDFLGILEDISEIEPDHVICCAGISGKPNIDWCEDNKQETILTNVVGQINVAHACFEQKVHCTLLGTGVMYDSKNEEEYSENDAPNFFGNFYVQQRILLEKLLRNYPVLNLRILYPISTRINLNHPKNVLQKLANSNKIINRNTSVTIIDDLFPLVPKMLELKLTGTFNFCNPGTVNLCDMIKLFKPEKQFEKVNSSGNRSYPHLNVKKLLEYFPDIQNAKESLINKLKKV